ncbi:MAG: ATP-binding protein [Prevotellaceae bacterium]|nr:ATP-binding protein [Prevotellaceae bacterium]
MQKFADYIEQVEIDSLWSGRKHILWNLNPNVNILSGINGVGKSTILNKIIKSIGTGSEIQSHTLKGVRLKMVPEDATWIRFDVIRGFDRPLMSNDVVSKTTGAHVSTELDWQLYQLQRQYLDYQVNVGNKMIEALQSGDADATKKAQELAQDKTRFQDIIDELFADTCKKLVRSKNEIRFEQYGEIITPYQLSSGEKQMLAILLTVLVEDKQHYVLFMDEPEVSLHIEWQEKLLGIIQELNPNAQIILTTHSPALIVNGWMDNVTEVSDITDMEN